MVAIVDPYGHPIERRTLAESQTAGIAWLSQQFAGHPVRGLTPARLASILEGAEAGDICQQSELFLDMEERDPHLHAELSKRRRAMLGLTWSVEPPRNPSAKEKRAARQVEEIVLELPDLEDALLDALDAIGHGFAALEIAWQRLGDTWLPKTMTHRPQAWFQLDRETRTQLRLRDMSLEGVAPWPFGWLIHRHAAKSGYLARSGLYRVLAWPWIMKQFSLRDLAEFLEIYGLPVRLGRYGNTATPDEKATLYRAVQQMGRLASGIIPKDMDVEFKAAAEGAPDPFMAMVEYSDRAMSKAILGQTLSADSQSTGLGSGVANLHADVRRDLLVSDARQLSGTLSRDLLYPIAALNGLIDDPMRSPRWVFDTAETADFSAFSESLQKLTAAGMPIPISWVREQLGIPEPEENEPVLGGPPPPSAAPTVRANGRSPVRADGRLPLQDRPVAHTASTAVLSTRIDVDTPDYADEQYPRLQQATAPMIAAMLGSIRRELDQAQSLEGFAQRVTQLYPELSRTELTAVLGQAFAAADLAGMDEVMTESTL